MRIVHTIKYPILGVIAVSLLVMSCGKVTQEVAPADTKKINFFTLSASVEVVSTKNITANATSPPKINIFTNDDSPIYFAVTAFTNGQAPEVESWGMAKIERNVDVSGNITFSSIASNKNNVTIQSANLKESLISLREDRKKDASGNAWIWSGRATKLKDENQQFLVQVYTEKDKYALYYLDHDSISGNAVISIDNISAYDSFIATLVITDLVRVDYSLSEAIPYSTFTSLFTQEFFDNISYSPAPNSISTFRIKTPIFEFNRKLEKTLIDIVDMLHNTDKEETENYIRKNTWDWMSKKAQKELVAGINTYKIPTKEAIEIDTSANATTSENTIAR